MRSPRPGDSNVTSQVERLNSSDRKIAFSCVLTAAWGGIDTGNPLHDKAGRPPCLNRRQPARAHEIFLKASSAAASGHDGKTRQLRFTKPGFFSSRLTVASSSKTANASWSHWIRAISRQRTPRADCRDQDLSTNLGQGLLLRIIQPRARAGRLAVGKAHRARGR
jgi:hypothetical protein